jgi:membrane associated rhomboid family serine protease
MNFFKNIPLITRSLIIMNFIMFFLMPYVPERDLLMMVGFGPASDNFNLIQPITSMFLHAGLMHIGMNMLLLYMFGRTLEYDMGQKKYLIFYLLCGIGGYLLHGLFYPDMPAIGASGAVFGVMLGMAVMYPNEKVSLLFLPFLSFKMKWIIGLYFAYEVYNGIIVAQDGVAHLGHVGGGLIGIILTGLWITKKFPNAINKLLKRSNG